MLYIRVILQNMPYTFAVDLSCTIYETEERGLTQPETKVYLNLLLCPEPTVLTFNVYCTYAIV